MKLVYRWSRFESSAAPSAMSTSQPHNGRSACRHRARRRRRPRRSVCLSDTTRTDVIWCHFKRRISFIPLFGPAGQGVRPTTKRRKAPRAGGELRAVHRGTDWRRQGGAGGSAVRGPHAKINCSFGDSFTGENSCMASGQLTQPALMRVRRMHPTSLKCCSPKTTNIVHSAYGRQV